MNLASLPFVAAGHLSRILVHTRVHRLESMDTDTPEATVYQEQAREFQRADVVRDVCCW